MDVGGAPAFSRLGGQADRRRHHHTHRRVGIVASSSQRSIYSAERLYGAPLQIGEVGASCIALGGGGVRDESKVWFFSGAVGRNRRDREHRKS